MSLGKEVRSRQGKGKAKTTVPKSGSTEKDEKVHIIVRIVAWILTAGQFMMGVVIVLMFGIYMFYGGGAPFPKNNIIQEALYDSSSLEKLADLSFPPGNIAVSSSGRVFFTFHPESNPPVQVCELNRETGVPLPFPSKDYQTNLTTVLSIRIAPDENGRELLWVLDYAHHAVTTPKIIAIDILTGAEVHNHEFSSDVAPMLSMLNDFQIDPVKQIIYIADAGVMRKRGAIIVYDIATHSERRVLDGHPSVTAKNYKTSINSTDFTGDMIILGVFTIKPNVDSIALSRDGKWLYFASVNDDKLYRIWTEDLLDSSIDSDVLGTRVQEFINKTQSDGMTTDSEGNLYYGSMEHSAVLRINTKFSEPITETLFQDDKLLRWPDGFSFGPDGYLYFTCSSLQHVIFKSAANIQEHGPYHLFRFQPGFSAPSGQ